MDHTRMLVCRAEEDYLGEANNPPPSGHPAIPVREPELPPDRRLDWQLLDEGLETGEGVPFDLLRGSAHAAGFDLAAAWHDWEIAGFSDEVIGTGVAVEIPEGWLGLLSLRSGLGVKQGALCHIGIIDSDFRGEIRCEVHNTRPEPLRLARGHRFAQLTLLRHGAGLLVPRRVARLSPSERGEGGFGSTGH